MTRYAIEHVGLRAADTQALAAWYSSRLGFREIYRTEASPPVVFLEDASGALLEIFPPKPGDAEPPEPRSGSHIAVAVPDYGEAVRDLESRGVVFAGEAKAVFGGGTARFFQDPEGNLLHIVHRPRKVW